MKRIILLLCLFFAAFFLRFYKLDTNPPSLTWDEAAWGYNAYSLGIDGKDEFGRFLPIAYLESFGDFKPPMYAYLDIIPVKLFGLNEFATRFPSAFLGSLTVVLTYFLVKNLFKQSSEMFALVSSGVLAISPWHILLSRAAFEANVATFFIVLAVLLFLYSSKKTYYFILSLLSFIASMYTFNSARIVSPILLLGLSTFYYKDLLRNKKNLIISFTIAFIAFIPLLLFLLTPQAKLRFREVNIFSDDSVVKRANQEIQNDGNSWWSKIIHNRRIGFSVEYLNHYFDHFSPSFLFAKGDGNPKFSTQSVGQMYLWEVPFFILGILFIFRRKDKNGYFIIFWMLISIIPAATARETPHALRIEAGLPTFQIATAYGLVTLYMLTKSKFLPLFLVVMTFLITFNLFYFLNIYFNHYPREYSGEWQYGYRDVISYTESVKEKYDTIYLSETLGRPYIYALFYGKYSPQFFRDTASINREVLGFVHVRKFGKYVFVKDTNSLEKTGSILFVDTPAFVPPGASVIKEFRLINNDHILTAFLR